MNSNPECDRVRLSLMAWFDGEADGRAPEDEPHVATCESCQTWLAEMTATAARFEGIEYPPAGVALWRAVHTEIQPAEERGSVPGMVWAIVPAALAWRFLQLSVDLPLPIVNSVLPVGLALVALWQLCSINPLAIATSAPELRASARTS